MDPNYAPIPNASPQRRTSPAVTRYQRTLTNEPLTTSLVNHSVSELAGDVCCRVIEVCPTLLGACYAAADVAYSWSHAAFSARRLRRTLSQRRYVQYVSRDRAGFVSRETTCAC